MKTAAQIAAGFDPNNRRRAGHLAAVAQMEGMRMAAAMLEGLLAENTELDDSQLMQVVGIWIKETKETGNE